MIAKFKVQIVKLIITMEKNCYIEMGQNKIIKINNRFMNNKN